MKVTISANQIVLDERYSGEADHWQTDFKKHLEHRHRHKSQKTTKLAMQHIHVFSMWWEAVYQQPFEPKLLTSYDLHKYRQHSLSEARVSAATWNSRLWALRIFCEFIALPALTDDIHVQKRGNKPSRHRALTKSEYNALVRQLELRQRNQRTNVTLFEYTNTIRDAVIVGLMLWTGLRVEEISLLDLDDIIINKRSGMVLVRHGKGDKERAVPLNKYIRPKLASWLALRSASSKQAVFNGKGTSRLSTRQLERLIKSVGYECRIPDVTPHWLRYTFAKRLEDNGATIEQIRDLLGHTTIETTRRYLRSGYDELQYLVDGL